MGLIDVHVLQNIMHYQVFAHPVFIIVKLVPQVHFVKHAIKQQIESSTQSLKNVNVKLDTMIQVLKNVKNVPMLVLIALKMQINVQIAIQFREFLIITGVNVL